MFFLRSEILIKHLTKNPHVLYIQNELIHVKFSNYFFSLDVWSLGVILFMLVCGHPPFQEANDSETLTMIMDCKYTVPAHLSDGCRQLIAKMLLRDPDKRATLQQIAVDPWLTQDESDEHVPEYLPLVSRRQVSEEDHNLIIQKIANGNIATKEEILE